MHVFVICIFKKGLHVGIVFVFVFRADIAYPQERGALTRQLKKTYVAVDILF